MTHLTTCSSVITKIVYRELTKRNICYEFDENTESLFITEVRWNLVVGRKGTFILLLEFYLL